MRPAELARSFPWLILAVACSSTSTSSSPEAAPQPSAAVAPAPAAAQAPPERTGTIVPSEFEEVSIWPEAYAGELLVIEVRPHGATIEKGDVIARLETRSIDEQIHQAELEARSARIRHEGVVARNAIDDDAASAALEQAKTSLERARRTLEGWTKREIPFARRGDEISKKYEDAGIDDQKDELSQLEKMYSADELVEATEEIVMKRSRRQLAISEESRSLSGDHRQYRVEYDEAMQTEVKQEAVRSQELALDRLVRGQAVDRWMRKDALERSEDALRLQEEKLAKLKRDLDLFAIRAPRAGVLLHGRAKDYRPGRTPARYERGSQLSSRGDLFLVANPEAVAVAVDVPESNLGSLREGQGAEVRAAAATTSGAKGTLCLEAYPAARGGDDGVFEAVIALDAPIPGARFGMRAKVSFTESNGGGQAKASP